MAGVQVPSGPLLAISARALSLASSPVWVPVCCHSGGRALLTHLLKMGPSPPSWPQSARPFYLLQVALPACMLASQGASLAALRQAPGAQVAGHLKMPSVWSPLSASTSSDSRVCTQGSCRSGKRSLCMLMTSCSALPNMDGLNTAFLACRISSTLGFFSPCKGGPALCPSVAWRPAPSPPSPYTPARAAPGSPALFPPSVLSSL